MTTTLVADTPVDGVALSVLIFFFAVVTVGGFFAARWRKPESMHSLDEWGLGGRSFGTITTWFLLGGDLYTAYTFVAVPAAMYATGAVSGFFAVPYTIVVYPIIFIFMPRLWSVAHAKGYVTPADFVRGRYDSGGLSLAVALTGILATMPYIALQLVGIQAVLDTIGLGGSSNTFLKDLPLFIAFAVLAAFTYSSGLRAPALIAFVKDTLIYLVIVVAVVWVAIHLGFGSVFDAAKAKMETATPRARPLRRGVFIPGSTGYWAYATLALGSALALFMYPHSMTAVLSGKSRNTIRRNATILPAYSLMLGMLALLGFAAISAKTSVFGRTGWRTPSWQCHTCSRRTSRAGSPASPSRRSRSARWSRRPSCRSRPRTFSPATSTRSTSARTPPPTRRRGPRRSPRSSSSSARCCSSSRSTSRMRSTCSFSAGYGSCRPSWRSSRGSSPAGSTAGRCSRVGRSAWCTAR